MMKPISKDWTPEERIRVAAAYIPLIKADIYAGRYSERGRPNLSTIEGFLRDPPSVLECYRSRIEKIVAEWESDTEPRRDPDDD